jgi:hypothetical protein
MAPGARRGMLLKAAVLILALWLPVAGAVPLASVEYVDCPVHATHGAPQDGEPGIACGASFAHCTALAGIAVASGAAAPDQRPSAALVPFLSASVLPGERPPLAFS